MDKEHITLYIHYGFYICLPIKVYKVLIITISLDLIIILISFKKITIK